MIRAEEVGSVDTVFKLFGPDYKIVVEAFDDPDVPNVTCYLSRAKTGGIQGGLGLAEDTSDAVISYQQVGPITLSDKIKSRPEHGSLVFQECTSLIFKRLQAIRFYDPKYNALVYFSYSDPVEKCAERGADYALGRIASSVTAFDGAVRAAAAPPVPVTACAKAFGCKGNGSWPGLSGVTTGGSRWRRREAVYRWVRKGSSVARPTRGRARR